jgi:uncharacterized membrane protein
MWSALLHRREDWTWMTAPPRAIVTLIALIASIVGTELIVQGNARFTSPVYAVLKQWGRDAQFHAKPMQFWGILFLCLAMGVLVSCLLRIPVLTGLILFVLAIVQAFYAGASWSAFHADAHQSASHATMLTGLAFWWVTSAAGLLNVRADQEWPAR